MSKLKHTPGPWRVAYNDNSGPEVITNGESFVTSVNLDHETWVDKFENLNTEQQANARLIAAAPDMLKELIDFCAYNCTDCSGHIEGCSETCGLKNAKEIIEKATGMSIEEILK